MSDTDSITPVAVVTGSSSGIGAATARRLANDGFHVVVHAARNARGARRLALELAESGQCETQVELCDFSVPSSLSEFVDRCFSWRGRVDAWINNAGADVLTGESGKLPFEKKLKTVLEVDVVATLVLSRLVAERMKAQPPIPGHATRGSIVNMGWDQAATGMAGDSGQMFAASKGAIMAATSSLAQSFAPDIRVNCTAPGWIQTAWGKEASEPWQARARRDSLLDRWGQPDDVAAVVSFLCGPDSQFVNGHVIPVNGGFRTSDDGFTSS